MEEQTPELIFQGEKRYNLDMDSSAHALPISAFDRLVRRLDDSLRRPVGDLAACLRLAAWLRTPVRRFITQETASDTPDRPVAWPERLHLHGQRELHFVLAGTEAFAMPDRQWILEPGDLVFVDEWVRHNEASLADAEKALVAVFHFNATPWVSVMESPGSGFGTMLTGSEMLLSPEVVDVFTRRCREASRAPFRSRHPDFVKPAAQAVLNEYARAFARRVGEQVAARDDAVMCALVHIRTTAGRDCTPATLARWCGMPEKELGKAFQARTGLTVHQAINRARMEFYTLARVPSHTQKEIASALGFSSVCAFNRWLRHGEPSRQGDVSTNRPNIGSFVNQARRQIAESHAAGDFGDEEARRQRHALDDLIATEAEIRRARPRPERLKPEPSLMRILQSRIQSSHGAGCSLEKLAVLFKLSTFRLAHLYRQEIGETIGDTIDAARTAYITKALRNGVSTKKICQMVGFQSTSGLIAWRRRHPQV